jgi:hypothetical protein
VTRYAALYTSLSTSYDLEFNDDGTLAQPFPSTLERAPNPLVRTVPHEVSLRRERQLKLSGLLVKSNTEGFVHCEQFADLSGNFSLLGAPGSDFRLRNGTGFTLRDAGVLRRTPSGTLETAWIGELPSKATVPLQFSASGQPYFAQWRESLVTFGYHAHAQTLVDNLDQNQDQVINRTEATADRNLAGQFVRLDVNQDRRVDRGELVVWCRQMREGELSLGTLIDLAARSLKLLPGETRLIGWSQDEIPGVTVQPAAAQQLRRTLFLVHMVPGQLPQPMSDVRLPTDIMILKPENEAESAEPNGL